MLKIGINSDIKSKSLQALPAHESMILKQKLT